jgi:Spy/CpxP family protein refolding chaperone
MSSFFSRKRLGIGLTVVLLLIGLAAAIFAFRAYRDRAHLARIKDIREELRSGQISPEKRRELFAQLRTEGAQLSPQSRQELGKERRQEMEERIKHYFSLSPKERKEFLDKQINNMQAWRQQNGGGGAAGVGRPGGAPGGGAGGNSPEDRNRMRMQFLDQTTPEQRAMMQQFRQDLRSRMQQRGMSPPGGGGPGR